MDNYYKDYGCFDELAFYGNPSENGSTTDLPFASCHFNPIFFSSSEVYQQKADGSWTDWKNHMNWPVKCKFSVTANSITTLNIKVCETRGSGSRDPMYIRMKNNDGDNCTTEGLPITDRQQGHFLSFSSGSLGSCKDFLVTEKTEVWLSNDGNDDLCITDLYLDTATKAGTTKMIRCRYNADTHLLYSIIVQGERGLPLICY